MASIKQRYNENKSNYEFSSLRFPEDLGPVGMIFNFVKYSYDALDGDSGWASSSRTSAAITLPIPQTITDNQGVIIDKTDLGLGGAAVLDAYTSAENAGSAQGALNKFSSFYQESLESTKNIGSSVARGDLSFLGGGEDYIKAVGFLGRTSMDSLLPGLGAAVEGGNGTTINTHQSLNFDGVTMKRFEFQWQFAPKNQNESDTLKAIERKVKRAILPEYEPLQVGGISATATDRAFLSYPDVCMVSFMGLSSDHYFKFKPGFIESFNVNYSPQGNVLLKGGKPGVVDISMSLLEARIHTRDDYK